MENQKDPHLTSEDDLKAENNLLKLKLGLEHGMQMSEFETLSPELENQWLKSVYAFEQQYKDAKRAKVYDVIGRPTFSRLDEIPREQVSKELQRIHSVMQAHGVELDCICKYDDALIYKFITEELFEKEMDDMHIPGMSFHFIYEEFHPNHNHEIRDHTEAYLQAIFARSWDAQLDEIVLAQKILFSGKEYDRRGISSIISMFQEAHTSLYLKEPVINEVVIDAASMEADVKVTLSVSAKMKDGGKVQYDGNCSLHFVREHDYWSVAGFEIPGLSARGN